VLPETKSILDELFSVSEGEKEVRLGATIESLAPELLDVAKKARRLRSAFDRPAALVMPFELEIR
jgi:hypothetical protein